MKFDVDLATGTVKAEFSLDETHEILDALKAAREATPKPSIYPPDFEMLVESDSGPHSYLVRIWWDAKGKHGHCPCGDRTYRHNWCKHLVRADRARRAQGVYRATGVL